MCNFAEEPYYDKPMKMKIIKGLLSGLFSTAVLTATAFFVIPAHADAQDMIARQAPIDRRLKAIDSVAISRVLKGQRYNSGSESSNLYTTWDTERVHCYDASMVPEHFRIDLRGFHMPTPSRVITSNYGYRATFGRMHKGLDIKVYTGDTISSAFDGKVRVVAYEAKGYGKYVVIRHNNGLETIYGHLSKHLCKVGDVVRAGEPIGLGGNTGRSTGSHLHFETRLMGEALDPSLLFDFVAQDVTCDFYDFYRSGGHHDAGGYGRESDPALASNTGAQADNDPLLASVTGDNNVDDSSKRGKKSKKKEKKDRKIYKVRKGDTLYSISHRVGCTVGDLCSKNGISQGAVLRLGQVLRY